jgi:hypothetical protein
MQKKAYIGAYIEKCFYCNRNGLCTFSKIIPARILASQPLEMQRYFTNFVLPKCKRIDCIEAFNFFKSQNLCDNVLYKDEEKNYDDMMMVRPIDDKCSYGMKLFSYWRNISMHIKQNVLLKLQEVPEKYVENEGVYEISFLHESVGLGECGICGTASTCTLFNLMKGSVIKYFDNSDFYKYFVLMICITCGSKRKCMSDKYILFLKQYTEIQDDISYKCYYLCKSLISDKCISINITYKLLLAGYLKKTPESITMDDVKLIADRDILPSVGQHAVEYYKKIHGVNGVHEMFDTMNYTYLSLYFEEGVKIQNILQIDNNDDEIIVRLQQSQDVKIHNKIHSKIHSKIYSKKRKIDKDYNDSDFLQVLKQGEEVVLSKRQKKKIRQNFKKSLSVEKTDKCASEKTDKCASEKTDKYASAGYDELKDCELFYEDKTGN